MCVSVLRMQDVDCACGSSHLCLVLRGFFLILKVILYSTHRIKTLPTLLSQYVLPVASPVWACVWTSDAPSCPWANGVGVHDVCVRVELVSRLLGGVASLIKTHN